MSGLILIDRSMLDHHIVGIKNGPKAPLTKSQERFLADWRGQSIILATEQQAHEWARSVIETKKPRQLNDGA